MGERIRKWFRRLFYYSSRQLFRRRRIYLSVFFTTIALMTVSMTALERAEATWLRNGEIQALGRYHAKIIGLLSDRSAEIREDKGVKEAWVIPWSSRLASSENATAPARVSVENEVTDHALNVTYIWGHAPGDGEIAVSDRLYSSVNWLEAGEVNDLWFTASRMTWFPLTVCGIFTDNDENADYVFVSAETAREIDRETGAVMKYDHYFNCVYNSDRFAAKIFNRLWRGMKLTESDYQGLSEYSPTSIFRLVQKYRQYLNTDMLSSQTDYAATPAVIQTLPVIAAAALILAVFMTNWTAANAPELGILGAIGANRRELCAISAGQILLISLIAAPPVILLSALISLIYVTAFNRAVIGIGYVFTIPWINLLKASLWFTTLSVLFTYIGIAAMTREAPFVLISGSWRGKSPFVRRSSRALERVKDKVARLALLETLRQIRGEVVHAVIGALLCLSLAVYLINQVSSIQDAAARIGNIKTSFTADTVISEKTDLVGRSVGSVSIPVSLADKLRSMDGVAVCGTVSTLEPWGRDILNNDTYLETHPMTDLSGSWQGMSVTVADPDSLPFFFTEVREGDPDGLFADPFAAVLVAGPGSPYLESAEVGDEFGLLSSLLYKRSGVKDENGYRIYEPQIPEDVPRFHIAAVVNRSYTTSVSALLVNPAGAEAAGLIGSDICRELYIRYDEGLTEEEGAALTERLSRTPALLRYDVKNARYMTESERGMARAESTMNTLFLGMLFLSFWVMTSMNASMKTARSKKDFAVKRQMGASDRDIYRHMRVSTYPSAVITFCLIAAVLLGACAVYILTAMAALNIQADMYPLTYTPEFYAKCRAEIFYIVPVTLLLLTASLPMQAVTALAAVFGTIPPTRRLLKEPVTEGLRRDTD